MSIENTAWAYKQELAPALKLILIGMANAEDYRGVIPEERLDGVAKFCTMNRHEFDGMLDHLVLTGFVVRAKGGYALSVES